MKPFVNSVIRFLTQHHLMSSLQNDNCVRFYIGLPSFRVLKAVFEFVAPPMELVNRNPTKLTDFQEFMIVMAKLRLDSNSYTSLFHQERLQCDPTLDL